MKKEPIASGILNFLYPGIGYLYNGDNIKIALSVILLSSILVVNYFIEFFNIIIPPNIMIYLIGLLQGITATHGVYDARRINYNYETFKKSLSENEE